jgi:hypothetical protein
MSKFSKKNGWEITQFQELVKFAKQNGLQVIPEIKFLTHQKLYFNDKYPELMFNEHTYDPRNSAVYDINYKVIDEIVRTIQPTAIHIGHDEVHGWRNARQLKKVRKKLPAKLYLQDVLKLHGYIRSKGLQIWMWSDMLLSKDQFPKMKKTSLHGYKAYGNLAPKLPKDIVIMDWHYKGTDDFSSITYFDRLGFRVVGTPWNQKDNIKSFSKSVYELLPQEKRGMCASTWSGALKAKKHKFTKASFLTSVKGIIEYSGRRFWNVK